jgi:hypothetical protein
MIFLNFLAMIMLYAVYRLTLNKVEEKNDELGMFMVFVLLFFGALFLIIDLIGEIKGLF